MPCLGLCNPHAFVISHFFGMRTGLAIQSRCGTSLTKPVAKSLDNSSPMAQCFSWLKHHRPFLISLEPGLMLRVCLATSRETPGISAGLHANMSLLRWRKSTSSLSYLGFKLATICMVLAGFPASIWTALVPSSILKMPDVGGIARLSSAIGNRRLSSYSSAVVTAAAASLMLSCTQSSAHRVWTPR
jgi:hypothetical protein